ncbi:glycosyltransferase [Sutcliffiella horikoshii]|uniref:glycosyltransferase n=1 Tax=Sutcliffiella horikoshii TaxID=79883 RepID=UPI00384CDA05
MKYKILIFIPTLDGGGAERIVATLANNLDVNRYEVTLLLLKKQIKYNLNKDIRIEVLNCNSLSSSIPKLIRYTRKNPPDLMISNMSLTNIVSIITKFLSGKKFPLIVVEHSTPSIKYRKDKLSRRLIPFFMRITYKYANKVVCVSKGVKSDLQRVINNNRTKINHVYNPIVDTQIEKLTMEEVNHKWFDSKNSKKYKVILGVGRLEPVKNFKLLIEAFSEVNKMESSSRLIILGEGSQRKELEELVIQLNIKDVVDMPGFVNNPYCYLSNSSLFVLSSDLEGLPTVLVEALACGTPVVSTDCPNGPREILDDGKYGELVPTRDQLNLKKAIINQLNNHENKEFLKRRASFFSVDNAVTKYDQVISETLSEFNREKNEGSA